MARRGEVGSLLVTLRMELNQLRVDLKEVERTFSTGFANITRSARGLAGALGVGLSVGAVVAFGRGVVNLAGQLKDLEGRTGISARTLSGLKSTLEQNGVSLEGFATSISRAQKQLGGIDSVTDPAAKAIKDLGLNLQEMQEATPEEFLQKFLAALAKVPDHNRRIALGAALMGKSFAEILPALQPLVAGFDQLKTSGMTAEQIQRLDDFGDSLTRINNTLQIMAAGPLAEFSKFLAFLSNPSFAAIQQLDSMADALARVQRNLRILREQDKTIGRQIEKFLGLPGIGPDIKKLEQEEETLKNMLEIDKANKEARKEPPAPKAKPLGDDSAKKKLESFTEGLKKQLIQLKANRIELTEGGTAALRFQLTQQALETLDLKKLPAGIAKLIDQIVAGTAELEKMKVEATILMDTLAPMFEAIDEDQQKAVASGQDLLKIFESLEELELTPLQGELAAINQEFDKMRLSAQLAADATGQSLQDVLERIEFQRRQRTLATESAATGSFAGFDVLDETDRERIAKITEDSEAATKATAAFREEMSLITSQAALFGNNFDALSAEIGATTTQIQNLLTAGLDRLDPKIQQLNERLKNLEGVKSFRDSFVSVFNSIQRGIETTLEGVILGTQSFGDAMKNLMRNIGLSIINELNRQLIFAPIAKHVISPLAGLLSSGISALTGGLFGSPSVPALDAFGGQHGFSGVVTRPTMFMTGENFQPEAVNITPLSKKMEGMGQAPSFTVKINGDIIPRGQWTTPEQVVEIVASNVATDGPIRRVIIDKTR
jgi:hypothetical protein